MLNAIFCVVPAPMHVNLATNSDNVTNSTKVSTTSDIGVSALLAQAMVDEP